MTDVEELLDLWARQRARRPEPCARPDTCGDGGEFCAPCLPTYPPPPTEDEAIEAGWRLVARAETRRLWAGRYFGARRRGTTDASAMELWREARRCAPPVLPAPPSFWATTRERAVHLAMVLLYEHLGRRADAIPLRYIT